MNVAFVSSGRGIGVDHKSVATRSSDRHVAGIGSASVSSRKICTVKGYGRMVADEVGEFTSLVSFRHRILRVFYAYRHAQY